MSAALAMGPGCSSCTDEVEHDPWNVHESRANDLCALEEPTDSFERIDATHWSRVLPPIDRDCGRWQMKLELEQFQEDGWELTETSRICNQCDGQRGFRGWIYVRSNQDPPRPDTGLYIAGAFGVAGVVDEQHNWYLLGCDRWGVGLADAVYPEFYQVRIPSMMMSEFELPLVQRQLHPRKPTADESQTLAYYRSPVQFSDQLSLVVMWPELQDVVSKMDKTNTPYRERVLCGPEFGYDQAERQRFRDARDSLYFRQNIGDPGFPDAFQRFLASKNYAD